MKKHIILATLFTILLTSCHSDYTEVTKKEFSDFFIINSAPIFLGYFYEGSDSEFHYFTSRWQHQSKKKIKILKADLKVTQEFTFGTSELRLTVLKALSSGSIFCETEEGYLYTKKALSPEQDNEGHE